MSVAGMIRIGGAVAVGMISIGTLQAKPLTVKECVAEYRSAKAAGFLIKTTGISSAKRIAPPVHERWAWKLSPATIRTPSAVISAPASEPADTVAGVAAADGWWMFVCR